MRKLSFLLTVLSTGLTLTWMSPVEQDTLRTGLYKNGHCLVKGRYAKDLDSFNSLDTEKTYELDDTWTERCRNCTCDSQGAWCDGPVCALEYDFTQENWCIQWSEDGCCCEVLGCTVDGQHYALGTLFPYGEENPCLTCLCLIGTSRDYCLRQKCGTYFVICEDGNTTYDEFCCPHFNCPQGVSCEHIPDPYPETDRHELRDWFGDHLKPIPVGLTQHFHLDTFNTYVCICPRGGNATCRMETFSNN